MTYLKSPDEYAVSDLVSKHTTGHIMHGNILI